jgi:hypothetical protein
MSPSENCGLLRSHLSERSRALPKPRATPQRPVSGAPNYICRQMAYLESRGGEVANPPVQNGMMDALQAPLTRQSVELRDPSPLPSPLNLEVRLEGGTRPQTMRCSLRFQHPWGRISRLRRLQIACYRGDYLQSENRRGEKIRIWSFRRSSVALVVCARKHEGRFGRRTGEYGKFGLAHHRADDSAARAA